MFNNGKNIIMNDLTKIQEWKSRANAEYQKVISSIISLSTAVLVLPTLFLKDFVGINKSVRLLDELSCSVYVAWGLLSISIFCCIVYYYASAKWLKQAYGGTVKWSESTIESWLDITFWGASVSFISGVVFLIIFIVSYVPR